MVNKIVNSLAVTVSKPLYTEVRRAGCHQTDDPCNPYKLEITITALIRERDFKASALYLWLEFSANDQFTILEALNR
jgi:hypothetical protein